MNFGFYNLRYLDQKFDALSLVLNLHPFGPLKIFFKKNFAAPHVWTILLILLQI